MLTYADNSSGDAVLPKVVLSMVICVLGLLGNLIAMLLIIVLKEYKKSVTHWYILNLALADSVFLLTLPFKVSEDLNGAWIYPEWMCKGKESILFLNYYASILFLMIMTSDRYIAVCHTFSSKLMNLRKTKIAIAIAAMTWLISFLLSIPIILYSFKVGTAPNCKCSYQFPNYDYITTSCLKEGYNQSITEEWRLCTELFSKIPTRDIYCSPHAILQYGDSASNFTVYEDTNVFVVQTSGNQSYEEDENTACHYKDHPLGWNAFLIFNFSVMFLLPLLVMVFCYGLIIKKLSQTRMRIDSSSSTVSFSQSTSRSVRRKRLMSSRSSRNRKRITRMCATLVGSFLVCWLPFHAVHLAKIVGIEGTDVVVCERLSVAGTLLAFINSALNPYLYSFFGSNFLHRWRSASNTLRGSFIRRHRSSSSSRGVFGSSRQSHRRRDLNEGSRAGTILTKVPKATASDPISLDVLKSNENEPTGGYNTDTRRDNLVTNAKTSCADATSNDDVFR